MSTRTTKTPTALEQAQARRDDIAAALEEVRTFKAGELATVERIDADRAAGKLGTDYAGRTAAVAHAADAEEQEEYLTGLLEVAEQAHQSHLLAETMADLEGHREAVRTKRAETIEAIRATVAEYVGKVNVYNGKLTEAISQARRAGLIDGEADPTLPVLMGGGTHGHPRRLIHDGQDYALLTAHTDQIIREARA